MADTMETRGQARSTIEDEVKKAGRSPGTYQPSISEDLIARATIASAFQRINERMRRSMKRSPGMNASLLAGIVLRYGVVIVYGRRAPVCAIRADKRSSRKFARSTP